MRAAPAAPAVASEDESEEGAGVVGMLPDEAVCTQLPNCQITRLPNRQFAQIVQSPNYPIAQLPNCPIAQLHNCPIPDYRIKPRTCNSKTQPCNLKPESRW